MKMNKPSPGLDSDLRISHKLVILSFAIVGQVFIVVGDSLPDPLDATRFLDCALLLCAVSAIAWLLDSWKPWLGRWFTVIVSVIMVHLGHSWLGVPGSLALITIPIVLASALISVRAATAAAVGGTMLSLLLPRFFSAGADPATTITALIAIWATLGAVCAIYYPVYQINRWLGQSFQRAQSLLEGKGGFFSRCRAQSVE